MGNYPQEIRDIVARFTLMDDDFMTAVLHDNIPATELVLRIILEKPDLIVKRVKTQEKLKNLQGRSLTLDVLAEDKNGTQYNIEVQNATSGAVPQRARYHSALLDANLFPQGEDFASLHESYVVFITKKDVLGAGKPLYHIKRVISETNADFGDGSHILYVNGTYRDETPLGWLMQDFNQQKAKNFHYTELAEPVRYLKDDEGGTDKMCDMVREYCDRKYREGVQLGEEEGRKEGRKEGRMEGRKEGRMEGRMEGLETGLAKGRTEGLAKGRLEAARNTARSLLLLGAITPEQIALATQLPIDEVRQMEKELKA